MTAARPVRPSRPSRPARPTRPAEAEVWVDLAGTPTRAGRLFSHRRGRVESASFGYDTSYLANRAAYALDPALPLLSGTMQTPGNLKLFGAFADSCPDRWGRRLVERTEARTASADGAAPRSFGEFDLLLRVRDDLRQGAIRYRREGVFLERDDLGIPALTDLPILLSAAESLADDVDDPQSLALLLRNGSSLGGARPKAHVLDVNGRIAIAKFPGPGDEWDVMAWEKTALDLAARAGITVPENHLVTVAGRNVLVVDRFDRLVDARRRGFQSAMTALELTDGDVGSYLDLAELIEERSRAVTSELEQLFRRIAFFILISNTDDHLRNHAFLHVASDIWELSPAFDLNPDPQAGPRYLSTAIDGDTAADVDALLATAPLYRLDADSALRVLGEVRDAVDTWQATATHNGLSRSACAAMAPAFVHPAAERTARLLA